MKKVMFLVVLVAVLSVSLFGMMTPVFAGDGDNFKKAGQQMLQEREEVLASKKAEIDYLLRQISADRVITKDEMVALHKVVDDFNKAKSASDKYLKFYTLKTIAVLDEKLVKMSEDYFSRHFIMKQDYYFEVKRYFIGFIGNDVSVKKGMVVDGISIFVIIVIVFFIFFLVVCFSLNKENKREVPGGIASAVLAVALIALLFLF